MYKEYYLMRKEPFDSHPSPELFYKSNVHQTAWHYLVQGIKQHEPILVLAGEYGAGKTLLFLKIVRLLETKGRLPIVAVPSPTYNFAMILEKIVEKLLNITAGSIDTVEEPKLQQAVYEHFENTENRSPIYIVIDDAQEFSYSFINKLRLFASYNCDGFFPIRLIFFAHHSFLKLLKYKKLKALGQRIRRVYHLRPLDYEETKEYIYYRLIYSGATGTPVFNDDAVAIIQSVSGGNPRLINNVCDNCLLLAGESRVSVVDEEVVRSAMESGELPGVGKIEPTEKIQAEFLSHVSGPLNSVPQYPEIENGGHLVNQNQMFIGSPTQEPYWERESQIRSQRIVRPFASEKVPPAYHDQPSTESGRSYSDGSSFWSKYGKIGIILLLLLIVLFLFGHLLRTENSSYIGATSKDKQRIVRKILDRQNDEKAQSGLNIKKMSSFAVPVKDRRMGKRYEPVLLTDNLVN